MNIQTAGWCVLSACYFQTLFLLSFVPSLHIKVHLRFIAFILLLLLLLLSLLSSLMKKLTGSIKWSILVVSVANFF